MQKSKKVQLPKWLLYLILILLPVAFFVNLGVHPFIDDEGNRSLVALEMLWSGNFITPTLHGAYYYNKPPLWNWILSASFTLFGEANEWTARFPSVIALMGFATTIFYYYRKHFSTEKAFLIALLFITSGRILLWESLLALIDISFSWAMFTMMMVIFHEGNRGRWWRLFLLSYLLMVIGFMFKGLPAIVFQGFTLITYLVWKKSFLRLFSIPHILSGLLSLVLLGIYYGIYQQYNSLEEVFSVLFVESGKRTAASYGLIENIKHILSFPLEVFYHFLPWTFLILLAFRKKYRKRLNEAPIIIYGLLVFGVNIIVYWLSPNFYPRYILMLIPFSIAALLQMYPEQPLQKDWLINIVKGAGVFMICFLIIASITAVFIKETQFINGLVLKATMLTIASIFMLYIYNKQRKSAWFVLIASMLLFRIGFDLFAVPPRVRTESRKQRIKISAINFGHRWEDRKLAVFCETDMEPAVSFYMEKTLDHIIPRHYENLQKGMFYIYNPDQYKTHLFEPAIDSFMVRHTSSPYYYVGKLLTSDTIAIKTATIRGPYGF